MNNTFYFLRHGETNKDRNIPISKWVLSDAGKKQAKSLAEEGVFSDVDIIFSSTEDKAFQTAKPIADSLGKEIIQLEEISELNRDKGGFMEAEEYEEAVKHSLEYVNESIHNWETAAHALDRFSLKMEGFDREYKDKKILIVGHGFTINLYFAKLLGLLTNVYKRFNSNYYADWGIVRNWKVVKDIAI